MWGVPYIRGTRCKVDLYISPFPKGGDISTLLPPFLKGGGAALCRDGGLLYKAINPVRMYVCAHAHERVRTKGRPFVQKIHFYFCRAGKAVAENNTPPPALSALIKTSSNE